MSQNKEFKILMGELIRSPTTHYQVQKFLGSGTYGVVIQCKNMITYETVALKILKNTGTIACAKACAKVELRILQNMKKLHSDNFNIVRLNESFTYKERSCLVFEHLDMDLNKFMQISPGQHLPLKQIRPILQQVCFLNTSSYTNCFVGWRENLVSKRFCQNSSCNFHQWASFFSNCKLRYKSISFCFRNNKWNVKLNNVLED